MLAQFTQNIWMALQELKANKLRTFLSLLGITIGVFCVVSILTVFDSLRKNIEQNMQQLGSNVLYIGKFPWIPENEGEYQWWRYKARPVCTYHEMQKIQEKVQTAAYATMCYSDDFQTINVGNNEVTANVFAVTYDFNKLQPIDIAKGRYFSLSEMNTAKSNGVVIGYHVADELFGNQLQPIGQQILLYQKPFVVIGVMKKQGKTMTGFDFDNGIILPYTYVNTVKSIDGQMGNGFVDPLIMVKAIPGIPLKDMKQEIRAILRASRKIKPTDKDNFSFNQLDAIQQSLDSIFVMFNLGGIGIGIFSLLVGCFGIANIMFVSVKERTPLIGIKKAIGAKPSSILFEFLTESVILCILGGLAGIVLVLILAQVLTAAIDFPITLSLQNFSIGVIISIVVGVIAGYLPARKAASLHPVVAIRS